MSQSSSNISAIDIMTVENPLKKVEEENKNEGSRVQPITTIISVESQEQDDNLLEINENEVEKTFENISEEKNKNLRLNHFSNNSILTLNPLQKKGTLSINSEYHESEIQNDSMKIIDINNMKDSILKPKKPEFFEF